MIIAGVCNMCLGLAVGRKNIIKSQVTKKKAMLYLELLLEHDDDDN